MALLIDSSVLITLERRGASPFALRAAAPDEPAAIAAITASELLAGVHRADSTERRARRRAFVEAALGVFTVVPFDLRAARVHAQLWSDLAGRGSAIAPNDLQIAATAIAYGCWLMTENLRDFERIPGLDARAPHW